MTNKDIMIRLCIEAALNGETVSVCQYISKSFCKFLNAESKDMPFDCNTKCKTVWLHKEFDINDWGEAHHAKIERLLNFVLDV